MTEQYTEEWARNVIEDGTVEAESVVGDPGQVESLLGQVEEKLGGLPDTVTTAFKNIPLMADMVKSYITGEYTVVSPKVIISLVSAFLYLVKRKDIIPDNVPVLGLADDVAVVAIVMAINEAELAAYATWREQRDAGIEAAAPAEAAEAAAEPQQSAPAATVEAEPEPERRGPTTRYSSQYHAE